MRWGPVALAAAVCLGAACSGDDDETAPAATLGTSPPSSTTTSASVATDPYAIPEDPADIDEDYVQGVIDALFAVDAEATEVFLETGVVDPRGVEILESIYVGEELDIQVQGWAQALTESQGTLRAGALVNEVEQLGTTRRDCVFVEVKRDYSNTTTNDAPTNAAFLGLEPKPPSDKTTERNPTPWAMFQDAVSLTDAPLEDPCVGP